MSYLVLAQETAGGLSGGAAVGGTVSVTVTVAIAALVVVGKKVWNWSWTQIVAGACLGVAGGSGIVGELCWTIIKFFLKFIPVFNQLLG